MKAQFGKLSLGGYISKTEYGKLSLNAERGSRELIRTLIDIRLGRVTFVLLCTLWNHLSDPSVASQGKTHAWNLGYLGARLSVHSALNI